MDPFTWSYIALAVGTVVSATGTIVSGQQQAAASKDRSRVAENNRLAALASAYDEDRARYLESEELEARRQRILGQQASAASASGLQLNGSVFDVMTDSTIQSQLDQDAARRQSQNRSTGLLGQANDFAAEASMARAAGRAAVTSSYWGAGGTLLSGAGQVGVAYNTPRYTGGYRDNARQTR